ncbi:uncharacterized protein LOC121382155 isoform X2 [Gigantopelta aegis]|uniref:uncharacterized protein LOC121382155 isoform X1 n=1 Tax=Gigantopelta aegis TaxID=1735272 RepID=UPI001B887967|nr:uncharacterized protein LOC121382155 isoform X1 [Gigantopelta aegis]XP_041367602.1 uncharacterized protein LOC121382155 isoform X2 [Gigantopelta aegis]
MTLKPKQRTRRIQTCILPTSVSVGVQCELLVAPPILSTTQVDAATSDEEEEEEEDSDVLCNADSDYEPESESESEDSETCDSDTEMDDKAWELNSDIDPLEEKHFIVSQSCLASLFSVCNCCLSSATASVVFQKGMMIVVKVCCTRGHEYLWHSQPQHGTMPRGHLTCAGAILFSGSSISNILTLFHHMKVPMFSVRTYLKLQKFYLIPSVKCVWQDQQSSLLQSVQNTDLVLGGDARCDSPGHTAKYGTYTLLDLQCKKILDIQLVQSNEVKNSFWMELEGLKRAIHYLESKGCVITELVTDRHVSVKKYMRDENKEKKHFFDVWHMAKGIGKKLEIASKKSGCSDIHQWIKSASNHMYWVAASSGDDNEIKVDKWLSLLNHVRDQHSGHSVNFPECIHGPLEEKLWLANGTKVFKVFEDVIANKALLRDIPQLSPVYQTYALEVFHSVVNRFAPKSTHFFHSAMLTRMYLSALHYNENGNRPQDVTLDGELKWQICYPKAKKGEQAVVKPVKSRVTYDYVDSLCRAVFERRINFPSYILAKRDVEASPSAPKPLTAAFPAADKKELVLNRKSRFVVRLV